MPTLIAHCPICGLPFGEPVDIVELQSSYWICVCCGCMYRHSDKREYREAWLDQGAPWDRPDLRPPDWDQMCIRDSPQIGQCAMSVGMIVHQSENLWILP